MDMDYYQNPHQSTLSDVLALCSQSFQSSINQFLPAFIHLVTDKLKNKCDGGLTFLTHISNSIWR